jgi:hypothetical protein
MHNPLLETSLVIGLLIVQAPPIGESPTGQFNCRTKLRANSAHNRITLNLEFVYPQVNMGRYLEVDLKEHIATTPTTLRAYFSTDGEMGFWTVPVVQGIAPIVITRFPAKTEAATSLSASFSGYATAPVKCKPL